MKKSYTDDDIIQEFKQNLYRITNSENKLRRWLTNYGIMVVGLVIISVANVLYYQASRVLDPVLSGLSSMSSSTDLSPERIAGQLAIYGTQLSVFGAELTNISTAFAMGWAILALGFAWYTYRDGIRKQHIAQEISIATGHIIAKSIVQSRDAVLKAISKEFRITKYLDKKSGKDHQKRAKK